MIVQKKRQTSNESHSKLVLDLAKCPQSINKSKRELTTAQNSHKRKKSATTIFDSNQQQKISISNLATKKDKKVMNHTAN